MQSESTPPLRAADGGRRALTNRRRLLQAAGAAAVGGSLAWGLVAGDGRSSDRTSIVYAVARPDPESRSLEPRTKEVPTVWYEQLQRAFDIQADLLAADLVGLVGAFAVPGSYDEPAASVAVDATDDGIQETLDDLSGNLSISLDVVEEIPPLADDALPLSSSYQVPDLDLKDVPGGVACTADGASGTLAPAMYVEDDPSSAFATSNHLFGAAGAKSTEHRGAHLNLYHDGETRPVGRVVRGYPMSDVVRVEPVDGYRPLSTIARASPGTVIGQYTRAGLADLMARREPLSKAGAFSDLTAGPIKGIDGVTCYVGKICKRGQLRWGHEDSIVDGDSGSVSYHADPEHPDDYVLVAGINNARTWWPGMDFTWGTSAHHLRSEYGLHF